MTAYFEPLVASPRILAGTRADLQLACYRDGQLTNPTGTITCTVTDAAGTSIATPTVTATAGVLMATLTAAQTATVNLLTVTWAGMVFDAEPAVSIRVQYEVVGDLLFTIEQARQLGLENRDGRPLQNVNRHPNAKILQERDRISDDFEDILGFALGTRYGRDVMAGTGNTVLWLDSAAVSAVRSVETRSATTWTAYTSTQLESVVPLVGGRIILESGCWPSGMNNVRIAYEHGLQPIPGPLKRAAMQLLLYRLTSGDVVDRRISVTDEHGTTTLATPGKAGSHFGLPDVDEVLNRWSRKLPGVA